MESNRRSRKSILDNQKVLILVSILVAIVLWLGISMTSSPTVQRVVRGVPVTVDDTIPAQLGYEAFGVENLTVDVTVSGRRYEVGDNVLKADDIQVTAVSANVDSSGKYTLGLVATPKDSRANYSIVSKSRDYIDVFFDTPKTTTITIEPSIKCKGELISNSGNLITTNPILSQNTVTIYGPSSEVDSIEAAYAAISTDGNLRSSRTYKAKLRIVDEEGKELEYVTARNLDALTVTIPVYKLTNLPATVSFTNAPAAYVDNMPNVTISPRTVDVGVEGDKLKEMKAISLGDIDFSTLSSGTNTYTFRAGDITDGVATNPDELYTVTVDMGELAAKTVTINNDNMVINNENPDFHINPVKGNLSVTVMGPSSDVDNVTADDLSISADLTGVELKEGINEIPVTINTNSKNCWAYGTYTVRVKATKTATNN